jgi:hypothetical protein
MKQAKATQSALRAALSAYIEKFKDTLFSKEQAQSAKEEKEKKEARAYG